MTTKYHWRMTGFGILALLGAACGDDANGGMTASASGVTSATGAPTTSPGSTSTGDASPTTSATSGFDSDSDGQTTGMTTGPSTTDPSTTDPGTTTESQTATSTPDPSTTDSGTTTDGTTSTTTGGVDTDSSTGSTGTTGGDVEDCPLAQMQLPCDANSDDPLHALGLNCTSLGGQWQDGSNAVAVKNLDFQAAPAMGNKRAWQVAKAYGSYIDPNTNKPYWRAREGEKVLLISSGLLPGPNNNGAVVLQDGDVQNDVAVGGVWDSDVLPPPMSPQKGSPDPMGYTNCDGVGDCSNTLLDQWNLGEGSPEDKLWFSFDVTAPAISNGQVADANGYTFDFAYFSAEFPEFVDTGFNDIFVVWQASEDYTGNVTFINGQPLTVTALWPIDFIGECDIQIPNCQGGDPHLQGTGYLQEGGATGWYKATSGVKPGETFTLAFSIFDMGDSYYDSTAIIDNWSWDCEGCVPNEINDCGIAPQ